MNKKEKQIITETENTIKKINQDTHKTKQIILSIDLITKEYHIFKVSKEKYKYTNKPNNNRIIFKLKTLIFFLFFYFFHKKYNFFSKDHKKNKEQKTKW